MPDFQNLYLTLQDGTLKQINPLTGTEVWSVPNRAFRPLYNRVLKPPKTLEPVEKENYCDFCRTSYFVPHLKNHVWSRLQMVKSKSSIG